LVIVHCSLFIGHWPLFIGHRLLVIVHWSDCWSLIFGHWSCMQQEAVSEVEEQLITPCMSRKVKLRSFVIHDTG